ncbi:MAG: hypothetical protein DRH70_08350 [Candidatus Coatesbacteria bacterium]|nr:MAG: hypothetical protein DRH70_08350 [Candidatus Coatesbacteria bacterium]
MAKKPIEPFDLSRIRQTSLSARKSKVSLTTLAAPYAKGASFKDLLDSLPDVLAARDFKSVVDAICEARRHGRHFVWAMGAHSIKCGLSPVICDLIRRGIITAVALNGAGMIHDFELAFMGKTSEDVGSQLDSGEFGMAKETADFLNGAAIAAANSNEGLGLTVGKRIINQKLPYADKSILATCAQEQIPATLHVSIGTDIVHMHPSADGAAIGKSSFLDFRLLTSVVAQLSGGVFFHVGSTVILPEVFLKAFAIAQNTGANPTNFTTVNVDFIQHYRPTQNVLRRPTASGRGKSYAITGHFEIMLPLFAAAIIEKLT